MRLKSIFAVLLLLVSITAFAQQPVNNAQVAGTATSTAASGVQKVGIVGSTGTALDGTTAGVLDDNIKNVAGNAASTVASGVLKVGVADSAGSAVTSNSTTYSSKVALDVNVLGTLGTAFSTAGKVDVKAADGDVFVRQSTGSNLHVQCDSGCGASSTISLIPATSGGLTLLHQLAAASNNATSVKGSAGQLYSACLHNHAGYELFLKFYNKATSPAPASDTVVYEMPVQAGVGRCFQTEEGAAFGTGIAMALVKGISDTDNTSTLANDASIDLAYK